MPEWIISLMSVIVGAAIGIGGAELIQWWKRPKLKIDFEEKEGKKPYIPDYNDNDDTNYIAIEYTHRIKYLRLIVRNKGRKPAMDCEAKLELFPDKSRDAASKVALHWTRQDPELYTLYRDSGLKSIDTGGVFAPISLNIDDEETVDVFQLKYHFSTKPETDQSLKSKPHIESASLRELLLQKRNKYHCKVTIYSSNTTPESFEFNVEWNGEVEGFNKAFIND